MTFVRACPCCHPRSSPPDDQSAMWEFLSVLARAEVYGVEAIKALMCKTCVAKLRLSEWGLAGKPLEAPIARVFQ